MGKNKLRRLNILQENKAKLKIDPDLIPNLIPKATLEAWMKDDKDPYFKIQAIKYPIKANRINYQESFFEEFISKLKDRPIPGNKYGHEMGWGKRATTDFILVGAKMDKKGNGKGVIFLKNYIPPVGASGDNAIFIRENKSDMIHYSIVSWTKDEVIKDPNGDMIINVIGSIKGERNDAVEFGMGAMDQKTNEDKNNVIDNDDILFIQEEKKMNKEEILKALAKLKANADVTLLEVAEAMGLSDQIVTEKQKNAVAVIDEFEKLNIENPVENFKVMQKQIEDNAKDIYAARMTEEFGADKLQNGEDNLLKTYAQGKLKDISSNKFNEAVKDLKENDPIAKKLAADIADFNSDTNTVAIVEQTDKKPATSSKRKVDKV